VFRENRGRGDGRKLGNSVKSPIGSPFLNPGYRARSATPGGRERASFEAVDSQGRQNLVISNISFTVAPPRPYEATGGRPGGTVRERPATWWETLEQLEPQPTKRLASAPGPESRHPELYTIDGAASNAALLNMRCITQPAG